MTVAASRSGALIIAPGSSPSHDLTPPIAPAGVVVAPRSLAFYDAVARRLAG
jgi:hypothetical protein